MSDAIRLQHKGVADLVVRDTFGAHELIAPAADAQWAMYRPNGSAITTPKLVVPSVTVAPLAPGRGNRGFQLDTAST